MFITHLLYPMLSATALLTTGLTLLTCFMGTWVLLADNVVGTALLLWLRNPITKRRISIYKTQSTFLQINVRVKTHAAYFVSRDRIRQSTGTQRVKEGRVNFESRNIIVSCLQLRWIYSGMPAEKKDKEGTGYK